MSHHNVRTGTRHPMNSAFYFCIRPDPGVGIRGRSRRHISGDFASAGCVFSQDIPPEIIHESGDVSSNGKGKVTLREVNLPVLPSPHVDGAKPGPVNLADIVCRKPMTAIIRVE